MSRWVPALRLIGVGFYIAACILIGTFTGLCLDNRFDTSFFVIVGLIFGLIVAAYGVYRMLVPLVSKQDKENN